MGTGPLAVRASRRLITTGPETMTIDYDRNRIIGIVIILGIIYSTIRGRSFERSRAPARVDVSRACKGKDARRRRNL